MICQSNPTSVGRMIKMESEEIKISVVRGTQNGRTVYLGFLNATEIALLYDSGVSKVDIWGPSNVDGYQRSLSELRARKFGKFLKEGNFSPTNILFHIREKDNGIRISEHEILVPIPTQGKKAAKPLLYITDGQHRAFGISQAVSQEWLKDPDKIGIPVTIWVDDQMEEVESKVSEAEQFYIINTAAKRVRTDLAHQILLKARGSKGRITDMTEIPIGVTREDMTPLVTYITNKLSEDRSSSLASLIVRPNVPRNTTGTPSQGQFEDSLLDNYLGSGSIMTWAAGNGMNVGSVIKLLSNFWEAIQKLQHKAFTNPKTSFLLKTLGVHALNGALPTIMNRSRLSGAPSVEEFERVLSKSHQLSDSEFWDKQGEAGAYGGGKKAFKNLAKEIVESMEVAT